MAGDRTFADLPPSIELTLEEVTLLLEVLDVADGSCRSQTERVSVRRAIRLITTRLWPELGDLLDDDDA